MSPPHLEPAKPRYQVVWYWQAFVWPFYICREDHCDGDLHVSYLGWHPFFFRRMTPEWGLSVVYRWILRVGPLEVRRWVPDAEVAERIRAHTEAAR